MGAGTAPAEEKNYEGPKTPLSTVVTQLMAALVNGLILCVIPNKWQSLVFLQLMFALLAWFHSRIVARFPEALMQRYYGAYCCGLFAIFVNNSALYAPVFCFCTLSLVFGSVRREYPSRRAMVNGFKQQLLESIGATDLE